MTLFIFRHKNVTFRWTILSLFTIFTFSTSTFGQSKQNELEQFLPRNYYCSTFNYFDIDSDGVKELFMVAQREFTKKGEDVPWQEDNSIFLIWKFNLKRKKYELLEINHKFIIGHNHNCPLSELDLVFKDNYFTLSHSLCFGQFFLTDLTTFKYDKKLNQIVLHKVGMSFIDRYDTEKNIPDIVFSQKDFGIVQFADYESLEKLNIKVKYPEPKR